MAKWAGPLAVLVACTLACGRHDGNDPTTSPAACDDTDLPPTPDVASNRTQAWLHRPDNVPPIDPNAIVRACAAYGACQGKTPAEAGSAAQICLFALEFSAERAIPVSGWLRFDARVESFVLCMIANKDDCTAQRDICEVQQRAESCEEDGCSGSRFPASCNGTIAHFETCHGGFDRQCASAFAECDPQSITGCTDRPETACPPGVSKADRCDGDVRLGCDGTNRVSYHDCSRMGGTCGVLAGKADCVYPTIPGAECSQEDYGGRCIGHDLVACIANRRVSVTAPAVCP